MEPVKGSEVGGLVVFHAAGAVTSGTSASGLEPASHNSCTSTLRTRVSGIVVRRFAKVAEIFFLVEEISAAPIAVPNLIDQSYHLLKVLESIQISD